MNTIALTSGPFNQWPIYEPHEIECEAVQLLRTHQHLPARPGEVDAASLVQAAFGKAPIYAALEEDILGFVDFGEERVENIFIREELAELGDPEIEHQCRSTIAHEIGHGCLHAPYFCGLKARQSERNHFHGWADEVVAPQVVFRHGATPKLPLIGRVETLNEEASAIFSRRHYPQMPEYVRLAEWQANRFMQSVQTPAHLVRMLVNEMLEVGEDGFSAPVIQPHQRVWVAGEMSRVFNVSRKMANARLAELFPATVATKDLFSAQNFRGGKG